MKLLLFDLDGTLIHVKGAGREAKARAMAGMFGTDEGARSHPFGGKTDWNILHDLLADKGYTTAALGAVMDEYQALMAHHLAAIIGTYPAQPCPGALELIAALRGRDDVCLGVVTGNVQATAPIKLRACGFDPDWFAVGAYGSESPQRNDLPRLAMERAARHTGRTFAPAEVIVTGDTLADIACARAVGAVAVAVLTGFEAPAALQAAAPDYLLPDLTHFLAQVPL
ncbi:MAG: HAD family hydrolase [Anaerolineae bacterium]|nr:HAD family hydrolase [Anaerolineae bacterium]